MAVYKQAYKNYDGPLTDEKWRFWVLSRYAFSQVFSGRLLLVYFVLCFVPMLVGGFFIYLHHNLDVLLAFQIPVGELLAVDAAFFAVLMGVQSTLAFFMAAVVGPGLVSPDLTNGAMPLYLSRPLTRTEYTLGKFAVLSVLLSLITWVPGMFLFLMQTSLEGAAWMFANLRIAMAIMTGAWVWIATVSLLSLALSAWVKWRPVAAGMLFGVFFVSAGFGGAINGILRTDWGWMMNLPMVISAIWRRLFTGAPPSLREYPLPMWSAWLSLAIVCGISIYLLSRKVRAYEVVR
jgi:ABC-2 type transport system permease protein